jgi:hypothetical protein
VFFSLSPFPPVFFFFFRFSDAMMHAEFARHGRRGVRSAQRPLSDKYKKKKSICPLVPSEAFIVITERHREKRT